MNAMIQGLVDLARLEGGKLMLEKQPVDLPEMVGKLLRLYAEAMETRRIGTDFPPDLPPVGADPHHLERILTNLLTNALKFSQPGSPVLITARPSGNEVGFCGNRPGHRYPSRRSPLNLRPVPSFAAGAPGRQPRAGAVYYPDAGRGARRAHLGEKHPGCGEHILYRVAGGIASGRLLYPIHFAASERNPVRPPPSTKSGPYKVDAVSALCSREPEVAYCVGSHPECLPVFYGAGASSRRMAPASVSPPSTISNTAGREENG